MRIFTGLTLDEVEDLPASFSTWALAWDSTEQEVRAEMEKEAADKAGR
jgi:hypothetical protein